jgi:hypothetical protein
MGGKTFRKFLSIGVAIFAPYAAAALGLTGFAATAFSFVAQAAVGAVFKDEGAGGGGGRGVNDAGLLVNKQGSNNSIDVVYGDRRIGGSRVYINTTEQNGTVGDGSNQNQYLHLVIALCQGGTIADGDTGHDLDHIKGITRVLLNNEEAWNSTDGIHSDYSGNLDVRLWYGKQDQTVAAPDVTATSISGTTGLSNEWTSNHRMRSVAYAYLIFKYDREKFPGLPNVTFDVQGKGIRNASGTYTYDDATRKNPALILRDYLQSVRYGKGLLDSELDIASFSSAATYCTNASLEMNGAVLTGNSIFRNTQDILAAGNLNLIYSGGKYTVKPQKKLDYTGAYDFNTSNIVGGWQISLGSKKTRFNTVTVNFFNPDTDWQPDSVVIEPSAYLTADNNTINAKTMDLPYTSSKTDAERLARFYLDQSRYQTVVSFKASHEALRLDVGDPCTITHDVTGYDAKQFRVTSLVLNDDTTVNVTLVENMPDGAGNDYLEDNA